MRLISFLGMITSSIYFILKFAISSAIGDAKTGTFMFALNNTITSFSTALPYAKEPLSSLFSSLNLFFGIVGILSLLVFALSFAGRYDGSNY